MNHVKTGIQEVFKEVYGYESGVTVYSAPGRVNLIGEHTDYNDGYVLPTPIDRYIWVAAAPRKDCSVRMYAADFQENMKFTLDAIKYNTKHRWANYVQGVAKILMEEGHSLRGMDLVITGDVPLGAGLSSSAALEMAALRAFQDLNKLSIDPVDAAYIGKRAENEFVGVQCGVMDQFVSSLGEHGKAILIDCRTNDNRLIELDPAYCVVIVNTMKVRELEDSAYNERRAQCEEAVTILQNHCPEVKALRDFSTEQLLNHWEELPEVIKRRARHVVTENQRVLDAVKCLEAGDMEMFGELMYDSHESLRHDYEVSCRHLDVLVDATLGMDYVAGARMTGAGFGGCTVNLVENDKVEKFISEIKERYFNGTAKRAEVYLA
ncbi:MAG: galactokinase [Candidatus Bathyarchaeota archaeon]|nr:galactokinase [Candidatus Bathyarchaeota archaeon]